MTRLYEKETKDIIYRLAKFCFGENQWDYVVLRKMKGGQYILINGVYNLTLNDPEKQFEELIKLYPY